MEGIQVSVETTGPGQSISVIKVGGYIDTTTSAELEHSLSSLLKSNRHNIVIDLGNVDYISSAGWGIFISEIKGIREKRGDLKLARMIPDVYEVFELLEFHYILKAFDSVEGAVADFDQNLVAGGDRHPPIQSANGADGQQETGGLVTAQSGAAVVQAQGGFTDDSGFESIEEKLQQIVVEQPDAGLFQLIKALNSPRFGNIKLGWFEMRKHLKLLQLDSKKKRVAYFKQKSFG